ncbi:glycosyltransferase family 2 protein [Alphaproteobacteria bacterium]|nr:glycosyltransferase family 2 protein [Alphaproteobacteria bacterium]
MFNEALTIKTVVSKLLKIGPVIVVDDASSDGSGEIARKAGAILLSNGSNKGYDKSLKIGIQEANRLGYLFVVTSDGDGQIPSNEVNKAAEFLFSGADLVVGIREHKQRFAEVLFGIFAKFLWQVPDPLCGLKGYRLSCLQKNKRFGNYDSVGTELAIKMLKNGANVINFPIKILPRNDKPRFGNGLAANIKILVALFNAIG